MKWKYSIIALLIAAYIASCISCKKVDEPFFYNKFDSIPKNYYYQNEIFDAELINIYGKWKFHITGGFSGLGQKPDFDYLILKPIGRFGILRNDSLLTYGKILFRGKQHDTLFIGFQKERPIKNIIFFDAILRDVIFNGYDTLNFNARCCDMFNFNFVK
jgi:hypothetical protein